MPILDWMWEESEDGKFCREHEIRNRIDPADFSDFDKTVKSFHTANYNHKDIYELLPLEFAKELGIKAQEFTDKYIKINKELVDSKINEVYPDLVLRCFNSYRYVVEISYRFAELYDPYFLQELLDPIFVKNGDILYEGKGDGKGYFGGNSYSLYKVISENQFECIHTWGLTKQYIGKIYTELSDFKIIPFDRVGLIPNWERYFNGQYIKI